MKKLFVICVLLVGLMGTTVVAGSGAGSAFGCLTTARTLGMGKASFTGGLGLADATTVFGTFNYGLSDAADGRIKLGFFDGGGKSDVEITFGADFKLQVWEVGQAEAPGDAFDMALGGLFEYISTEGASVLQLGGIIVGSYPLAMSNGTTLTPYGRFNLRMERFKIDTPVGSFSDSDLRFGFNAGVAWAMSSTVNLYGEFQIDGNDGLFLGADLNIM